MTSPADPVVATILALKYLPRVVSVVQERVYGGEVPDEETTRMPRTLIVVKPAGTPALAPGSNDYIAASVRRIDVMCYAKTFNAAGDLANRVAADLKPWRRQTIGDHLVFWFKHSSGPIPMRDPDGDWPVVVVTMLIMLADERVA